MTDKKPFWERKSLHEMTDQEWESLCDGCGQCCMAKLIDDDKDEFYYTSVACRLYDAEKCRCSDYTNRQEKVSDCMRLTPENVGEIAWLPQSCAYRLLNEGKPLFDWHPLISGDAKSVQAAGISTYGKVTAFEQDMTHDGEYLEHLIEDAS